MFRISIRVLAAILLVLFAGRMAKADTLFYFTITDHINPDSDYNQKQQAGDTSFQGDIGYGWLEGSPSSLTLNGAWDGSYLITSGQITFTATDDQSSVGTWNLVAPIGPTETTSPQGLFDVDNLLYSNQDANAAPTSGITGGAPQYLTLWGLLFGNEATGQEINIWGNGVGPNNYSFYSKSTLAIANGANSDLDGTGNKGALGNADDDETFALTDTPTVPEPSVLAATIALLSGGGLSLIAGRRHT